MGDLAVEAIGTLVGLAILAWLWHHTFRVFLACWFPVRANERSRLLVNARDGRLFPFFRWSSAFLLFAYSLIGLGQLLLLGLRALRLAAG
jgi:hypothetical protein